MKPARGQSLIEFALVIVIVIFAFTVFIDLGRGIFYYVSLDNAAREGTRFASVNPLFTSADQDAVIAHVREFTSGMDPNAVTVTVTKTLPSGLLDYQVTVVVTYSFSAITPGLNQILGGGNIPLTARSSGMVAPIYNRANP